MMLISYWQIYQETSQWCIRFLSYFYNGVIQPFVIFNNQLGTRLMNGSILNYSNIMWNEEQGITSCTPAQIQCTFPVLHFSIVIFSPRLFLSLRRKTLNRTTFVRRHTITKKKTSKRTNSTYSMMMETVTPRQQPPRLNNALTIHVQPIVQDITTTPSPTRNLVPSTATSPSVSSPIVSTANAPTMSPLRSVPSPNLKRTFDEAILDESTGSYFDYTSPQEEQPLSKRQKFETPQQQQQSISTTTPLSINIFPREEIYQKLCLLMQKTFHASSDKMNVNQCCFQSFLSIFHANSSMYADYAPEGRLTLLYIASVYGQHKVLEFLLQMKASHNVIFKEHFTPVHVCARSGYYQCLKLLLDHGADYTAETTIGNRAIHIAATYGHLSCIKLLVQYGEHIDNNYTRNGVTPLQCAITHDRAEVLQWLLENGANPMIGRYEMESIFMAYAEGKLSDEHFKQILPIHVACRFNSIKCLKLLLDWGIDVNLKDEKQRTPLHTACLFNSKDAIKMLLKNRSCDPNMKDKQGAQPLHILFSLDSEQNFLTVARATKLEEKHLVHIWHHTQLQYKPRIANVIQQGK
jgi:ankyrin repeat protein